MRHCDKDHYEPNDRGSNSVTHPYCTKTKTRCLSSNGEQLLCSGGLVRDDQCQCRIGYESDCSRGFTESDRSLCFCQESNCPKETERNMTYNYDKEQACPTDRDIHLNYSCVTVNTHEISSTEDFPNPSITTPSVRHKPTSNSSNDGIDTDGPNFSFEAFLSIFPAAVFIFAILYKCN